MTSERIQDYLGQPPQPTELGSQIVQTQTTGGGREILTANREYFVRNDGNDSNDGLTNNAGGAFATIEHSLEVIRSLDSSGFAITLSGTGTFILSDQITLIDPVGSGNTIIQSQSGIQSDFVIDVNGAANTNFVGGVSSTYTFQNLTLQGGLQSAIAGTSGDRLTVRDITINDSGDRLLYTASTNSKLTIRGTITYNYTSGILDALLYSIGFRGLIDANGASFVITGNPSFSDAFAFVRRVGTLSLNSVNISGAYAGTGVDAIEGSTALLTNLSGLSGGTSSDSTSTIVT